MKWYISYTILYLALNMFSACHDNTSQANNHAMEPQEVQDHQVQVFPGTNDGETFVTIPQEKVDAVNAAIVADNLVTDEEIMGVYAAKSNEAEGRYSYSLTSAATDMDNKTITMVEEGLMDDVVAARKVVMTLAIHEGNWIVTGIKENYKCYPGRGHENWSAELCN